MRDREQADLVADGCDSDWDQFIHTIDDLLATGQFTWARETLDGIRQVVEREGRVTAAQRGALTNIENGLWPGRGR